MPAAEAPTTSPHVVTEKYTIRTPQTVSSFECTFFVFIYFPNHRTRRRKFFFSSCSILDWQTILYISLSLSLTHTLAKCHQRLGSSSAKINKHEQFSPKWAYNFLPPSQVCFFPRTNKPQITKTTLTFAGPPSPCSLAGLPSGAGIPVETFHKSSTQFFHLPTILFHFPYIFRWSSRKSSSIIYFRFISSGTSSGVVRG